MKIERLILLIHPAGWQELARRNPQVIREDNSGLFVAREKKCIDRWLAKLPRAEPSTLLIQHCGDRFYEETIKPRLGERNACLTSGEALLPSRPQPDRNDERARAAYQHEFHVNIVRHIQKHIDRFGLALDPQTATSEIWGGSFEGCAPGYAGAIAHGLALRKPPKMRFEMTIYDSRFLYGARRWEAIPLNGSDIEAWLFELHDGSYAAIYQARLSEQWLDKRPICVRLNPARMFVCTKCGYTIWPLRHFEKDDQECWLPYALTTGWIYGQWIRAWRMDYQEFRDIVASATVGNPPEGFRDYLFGGEFQATGAGSQ